MWGPLPFESGRFQHTVQFSEIFRPKGKDPHNRLGEEKDRKKFFYFRDNGAGFDTGDPEKLFRLFARAHNRSDFEGSGIGLASLKRIIERHGGTVEIQENRTWAARS